MSRTRLTTRRSGWSPGRRPATASPPPRRMGRCASGARRDGSLVHVLAGHDDGVWSATWSPDAKRLVSGDNAGRLCLWDAATGKLLAQLEPGGGAILGHGLVAARRPVRGRLARRAGPPLRRSDEPAPRPPRRSHRPREGPGVLAVRAPARDLERRSQHPHLRPRERRTRMDAARPPSRGQHGRLHAGRARAGELLARPQRALLGPRDRPRALGGAGARRRHRRSAHLARTAAWWPPRRTTARCGCSTSRTESVSARSAATPTKWSGFRGRRTGARSPPPRSTRRAACSTRSAAACCACSRAATSRSRRCERACAATSRWCRTTARVSVISPAAGVALLRVGDLHGQAIKDAAWSPDGDQLALASLDRSVTVFDVRARPERVQAHRARARRLRRRLVGGRRHARDRPLRRLGRAARRRARYEARALPRPRRPGLRRRVLLRAAARTPPLRATGWWACAADAPSARSRATRTWSSRWPGRPTAARLASGSRDATIRLWDAAGRDQPACCAATALTVWGLAVHARRRAPASRPPSTTTCASGATAEPERLLCAATAARWARSPRSTQHSAISGSRDGTLSDVGPRHRHLARDPPARPPARKGDAMSTEHGTHAGGYAAREALPLALARAREASTARRRRSRPRGSSSRCGPRCARGSWREDACAGYQERRLHRVLAHAVAPGPALPREVRRAPASAPRTSARSPTSPASRSSRRTRFATGSRTACSREGTELAPLPHPADLGLLRSLHGDRAVAALRRRAQRLQPAHLRVAGLPLCHNRVAYLFPYRLPFENNLAHLPQRLARRAAPARRACSTRSSACARCSLRRRRATCSSCSTACTGPRPRATRPRGALPPLRADLARRARAFAARFGCRGAHQLLLQRGLGDRRGVRARPPAQFSDNVVLELARRRRRARARRRARDVVVTGLNGFVQPFIRYRLGDVAVRSRERAAAGAGASCPCSSASRAATTTSSCTRTAAASIPSKITVAAKSPCFAYPGLQVFRDYQIAQDGARPRRAARGAGARLTRRSPTARSRAPRTSSSCSRPAFA